MNVDVIVTALAFVPFVVLLVRAAMMLRARRHARTMLSDTDARIDRLERMFQTGRPSTCAPATIWREAAKEVPGLYWAALPSPPPERTLPDPLAAQPG